MSIIQEYYGVEWMPDEHPNKGEWIAINWGDDGVADDDGEMKLKTCEEAKKWANENRTCFPRLRVVMVTKAVVCIEELDPR